MIAIKTMNKLPKSCVGCPMKKILGDISVYYGAMYECCLVYPRKAVWQDIDTKERPEWCPLVRVDTPYKTNDSVNIIRDR